MTNRAYPRPSSLSSIPSVLCGVLTSLLLLSVAAAGADDFDADREIRIAARMQEEVTLLARENAHRLLSLLQGYRFNQLADEKTLDAVETIHRELAALAGSAGSPGATNMPAIAALLLRARATDATGAKRTVLLSASHAQGAVIDLLERLVAVARARLGGLGAAKTMEVLVGEQQKLKEETGTTAAETIGLTAADLDEDLRADLVTMGRTQNRLRRDLADTVDGLLEHAAEVAPFQSDYSALINRAVAVIRDRNVAGLMSSAAGHITGNQLLQAGRDQTTILSLLEQALRILREALPVLVIDDSGGVGTDIGPGPAAGAVDGAFADVPPFEIASDEQQEEYVPGIGRVPLVKGAQPDAATWLVGLPEKERQVLTSAAEERFPNKYKDLLKAYYRALAARQEDE